jgi:hypothetical protein
MTDGTERHPVAERRGRAGEGCPDMPKEDTE